MVFILVVRISALLGSWGCSKGGPIVPTLTIPPLGGGGERGRNNNKVKQVQVGCTEVAIGRDLKLDGRVACYSYIAFWRMSCLLF